MGTAVPDWVKPPFVIFDIRALWQGWASECPDVKNYKWRLTRRSGTKCFIAVHIWQHLASKG